MGLEPGRPLAVSRPTTSSFKQLDGLPDEEDLLRQLKRNVAGYHLGAEAERPEGVVDVHVL